MGETVPPPPTPAATPAPAEASSARHGSSTASCSGRHNRNRTTALFAQPDVSRQAAVTIDAGRRNRNRYRSLAVEDRRWSSDGHDHGHGQNGMAVDNSVLHLTALEAGTTPVEWQAGR